jgi:hypothetical protein
MPGAPPPALQICRRCGLIAPTGRSACALCGEPVAEARIAAPPPVDDGIWVAVRCTFTCNSCKFAAPLDALEADGAVECACCGLRQRFDVSAWPVALDFAHGVGDLAWPLPEGRHPHPTLWVGSENPYTKVGDTLAFASVEGISTSGVAVDATPGHPVCAACHVPLTTQVTGPGALTTQCPRCGDRATYAVGDEARALSGSLVAALAPEHRTDRPRARTMATQAGVVALTCPGCGAPLSLGSGGRLQVCAFCKVACIVPARSVPRRGQDTPKPEVWWILFHGASQKRRELEAPTEAVSATAAKAALEMLKPGARGAPVGDAPGVYEAPEVRSVYWPQVALTLVAGSVAVLLGFALYAALGP